MNTNGLVEDFGWCWKEGDSFSFISSIIRLARKVKSPQHVKRERWSQSDNVNVLERETVDSRGRNDGFSRYYKLARLRVAVCP